jgi:hypothetical protein
MIFFSLPNFKICWFSQEEGEIASSGRVVGDMEIQTSGGKRP